MEIMVAVQLSCPRVTAIAHTMRRRDGLFRGWRLLYSVSVFPGLGGSHSGLVRPPAKRVGAVEASRGFESLPLRLTPSDWPDVGEKPRIAPASPPLTHSAIGWRRRPSVCAPARRTFRAPGGPDRCL